MVAGAQVALGQAEGAHSAVSQYDSAGDVEMTVNVADIGVVGRVVAADSKIAENVGDAAADRAEVAGDAQIAINVSNSGVDWAEVAGNVQITVNVSNSGVDWAEVAGNAEVAIDIVYSAAAGDMVAGNTDCRWTISRSCVHIADEQRGVGQVIGRMVGRSPAADKQRLIILVARQIALY